MISTFLVVSALLIIQVYARCPGTCGDRSQCLASGKRYEKGLCNGGTENVCCMNSISCDGTGMCRGDQYCRGQGGNPITGKCPGPSEVQCCKGQSSSPDPVNPNPVNPNPVNPNPVNPNPVNPVNPSAPSGSQGTCSYNGANGHCLPTSSCGAGMSSVASSRGAQGCGHIRSSSVQCCVASSAVPAAPSVPSGSSGSLTKCQVVALLREAGFAESQIPRMTCTAYYESTWRCGVVGPPNSNGSRDYGLFQANSVYWCSGGPGSNRGNGCSSSCEGLRDCRANVRCAKTILAQQGITAWYAYRSHRSECERYSISECGGAVAPPANPNPPVNPADPVTPQQPSNIPCRYQGVDGSCKPTSQCQLTSVASRDGASGCGHIRDADTQCCVQTSQQAPVNPAQPATPTEAPAEPSGSQGACSYAGNDGQCVPTQSCPSGRQSFPSSAGASGCNHIRDSNVQCCVVPPPQGSVPSFNVPAGRSCALARPQGCSAFTGSTLTVNIKFVDEVIRSHSHARNAGVRIYVTSSFRTSSSRVGVSTSRHKVGFAYDMNPNSCNADCMCPYPNVRNRGAKNFLDRIVGDSTIHWGGDPSNPIRYTPTGSSCRHDTVHIQSRVYEDRPRYSSVRTCLNRENSAGRFQRFPCTSGASLLNDGLAPDPDLAEQGVEQDSDAMSAGAIAGIVIGVLLACIAVVCVAVFVATRSSSKQESGEAITYSNEAYSLGQATPSAVGMDVIDMPDMVSARVDQADVLADAAFGVHSTGGSYAGTGYDEGTMLRRPTNGNQPTVTTGAYDEASEEAQAYAGYTGVGSYECDICGKKYDYAEDLAEHSALRH